MRPLTPRSLSRAIQAPSSCVPRARMTSLCPARTSAAWVRSPLRAVANGSSPETEDRPFSVMDNLGTGTLADFLSWALTNGVRGLGEESSPVALYEAGSGERGVVATRNIAEGTELMRIPLRLAITDHPDDEESNALVFPEAPWSVRLACKLLREFRKGKASPYWPYLTVLPNFCPGLIHASWETISSINYTPLRLELFNLTYSQDEYYKTLRPEAHAHSTPEEFRWALSMTHSRCFGSADPKGGVRVRMLLPLVCMTNHAGERALPYIGGPTIISMNNAGWQLVNPSSSPNGEWEMVVKSEKDIKAGEEIFISYGPHSNDSFLLHYGFFPTGSPNDSVVLFNSVQDASAWLVSSFTAAPGRSVSDYALEKVDECARAAAEAVETEIQQQLAAAAHAGGTNVDMALPSANELYGPKLKALPGGQLDRRLTEAWGATLRVLLGDLHLTPSPSMTTQRLVEVGLAMFCLGELVSGWAAPQSADSQAPPRVTLVDDLREMVFSAKSNSDDPALREELDYYARNMTHWRKALQAYEGAPGSMSMEEAAQVAACMWTAGSSNLPETYGDEGPTESTYRSEDSGEMDAVSIDPGSLPFDLAELEQFSPVLVDEAPEGTAAATEIDPNDVRTARLIRGLEIHKKMLLLDVFLRVAPTRDDVGELQRLMGL